MPTFKIIRTCKYTEELEIEAQSESEAWELAEREDFYRVYDDVIVDEQIYKVE